MALAGLRKFHVGSVSPNFRDPAPAAAADSQGNGSCSHMKACRSIPIVWPLPMISLPK